jgi:hypothetical protein
MLPSEKIGSLSMGFHSSSLYTNIGHEMKLSADLTAGNTATISASFSIPLIGILGQTEKFIPLNTGDMEINLTVDNFSEYLVSVLPAGVTITNASVSNMEFVGEVLQLEDAGYQELLNAYPDGFKLKSQSWSYASGQNGLSGGSSGTIDVVVPFSLNSMKQLIWTTQPSDAYEKKFAGVNPNLSSYQLIVGGNVYPQQPVNASRIAEVYYQNSKTFGSFYSTNHCGSSNRECFAKASSAYNGDYTAYTDAVPTTISNMRGTGISNKFVCGLDLELINQAKTGIYSGVSSRSSTNTLRLNINTALKNVAHALHMWVSYDVLLNFDWRNGQIVYSN